MKNLTGYEIMEYGKEFFSCLDKSKKIIIYGAGNLCKQCFLLFSKEIVGKIIGIAVTDIKNNVDYVEEKKVRNIDAYIEDNDSTVIIAIQNEDTISEIIKKLEIKKFEKILVADYKALNSYKILSCIERSDLLLKEGNDKRSLKSEEIFKQMLNIGIFLNEIEKSNLIFKTLSLTWGGSTLLDYALLRALVLKYQIDTYLEIGTYIGDSLTVVSDLVQKCYSISVPENHPAHMKNWCEIRHMNDYSNKLTKGDNIIQFQEDSKEFNYEKIKENVGLYFIDGDHSYEGVLIDSLNVLEHFEPNESFVVWHDCRNGVGQIDLEIVGAIREAAGEYFRNFYIFDNSMCGIYIPDKYINDFVISNSSDKLITYEVTLSKNEFEL